jgi:hypothetical protein
MVSTQLDLLITQIMSSLIVPQASTLLPGLRVQVGPLLAGLMHPDSKVGVKAAVKGIPMMR